MDAENEISCAAKDAETATNAAANEEDTTNTLPVFCTTIAVIACAKDAEVEYKLDEFCSPNVYADAADAEMVSSPKIRSAVSASLALIAKLATAPALLVRVTVVTVPGPPPPPEHVESPQTCIPAMVNGVVIPAPLIWTSTVAGSVWTKKVIRPVDVAANGWVIGLAQAASEQMAVWFVVPESKISTVHPLVPET